MNEKEIMHAAEVENLNNKMARLKTQTEEREQILRKISEEKRLAEGELQALREEERQTRARLLDVESALATLTHGNADNAR